MTEFTVSLIPHQFLYHAAASNQIAASTSASGDINAHTPVTIAGSINHSVQIAATSPAIAPLTSSIFDTSSGFFVAQSVIFSMIGCILESSCDNAGTSAHHIASCISPNVSLRIACCHCIVFQKAVA